MTELRLFTSESVTEGHPDKICDQISDSILDEMLRQDPRSRVAVETMVTTGLVHVAGEVTTEGYGDIPRIVRDTVLRIGYDSSTKGFDGQSCGVEISIGQQSPDIAQGVDTAYESRTGGVDALDKQGAGDQGLMFGYACDDTPDLMPLPIHLAHRLSERLTEVRKDGTLPYLRPDGKTQVTIAYDGDRAVRVDTVVLSTQHASDISLEGLLQPDIVKHVFEPVLAEHARSGAELTVVTTETDEDPSRFGVVQVDDDGAVTDYAYKPEDPAGTLVATEVFVFDVAALSEVVGDLVAGEDEAATKDEGETDEDGDPVGSSLGDYGESIVPAFVARGRVREHRLVGYWRDIGTLDAYVRAHREILAGTGLDVAAEGWPLITNPHQAPPAWVAPDARVSGSLLSPGCRVEGEVSDSVVGPGVVVAAGATVRCSLLLGDCVVPAGAVLDTVVVDVGGAVPAHEVTGRAAPAEEVVVLTPQDRGPAEDETTGSGRPGRSD